MLFLQTITCKRSKKQMTSLQARWTTVLYGAKHNKHTRSVYTCMHVKADAQKLGGVILRTNHRFPNPTNSHNPRLATGRQLSVRNLTVRKSAMGNTSKMSSPDPTFFFSNAVSTSLYCNPMSIRLLSAFLGFWEGFQEYFNCLVLA